MQFLKAMKPDEADLRQMLHKHLSGYQEGRSIKTLHASEVTKSSPVFCPREKAIMNHLKLEDPPEFLPTCLEVTFEIGRLLEKRVQGWFGEMNRAVGDWKCLNCGSMRHFQKMPAECPECSCKKFEYKEWRVVSKETDISCGIDLLLDLDEPKLTAVEIKTIDKDQFKTLVMPLAEHRVRTSLYSRCIADSDDPCAKRVRTDKALVLYVSKGGYGCKIDDHQKWMFPDDGFSPFKSFDMVRDDSLTETFFESGRRWKAFKDGKGFPGRLGCCNTSFTDRAKKCKTLSACWAGEF